jgi:hypothetical protein
MAYIQSTVAQAQTVTCPACNAQPNKPCTQPTDKSRTPVSWCHLSRHDVIYEHTFQQEKEG